MVPSRANPFFEIIVYYFKTYFLFCGSCLILEVIFIIGITHVSIFRNKSCIHFQAYHFQRDDVALLGFYKYFKEASEEEREHAYKLLEYQNKRGGRIVLTNIEPPEKQDWSTAAEAMNAALDLEKRVNEVRICHIEFLIQKTNSM